MKVWTKKIWQNLLFKLAVFFTDCVKRNSSQHFKNLKIRVISDEAYGLREREKIQPEPIIQKHLEIGSSGSSSLDAAQKSKSNSNYPDWTKEIQPFLHNQLSDHTRKAYENDLKQFLNFAGGLLDLTDIGSLKADHVILFRKALEEGRLSGKSMAQATINRKLASVKSFLSWLKGNQILKENVADRVKGYPQSQESALKGLSDEEVCKILGIPNRNSRAGSLHWALLHVLFYLGVRKGELIGLKMGDMDTERGVHVLRVRGKGHRVRILPLTEQVRFALEHYFLSCQRNKEDKEAPLFIPSKNPYGTLEKKLNPFAITYIVKRYAKKAGVLKPISPHSCRATCISNALDKKATHRSVQHLAGWSTPLMIQRYDKRREDLKNSAAFLVDYGVEGSASVPVSAPAPLDN